jgi:BON domain
MRRLSLVIVVAATTVLVPMFAMAGNQEVADQIAQNLKHSGKLSDYRIAVKFQDGTATVKGRVDSQEQMNTALKLVFKTPGVSRVVNQMTIGESETTGAVAKNSSSHSAQRVASSYTSSPVEQASAMEPDAMPQKRLMNNTPRPMNGQMPMQVAMRQAAPCPDGGGMAGAPRPMYAGAQAGVAPVRYDEPSMPNYSWPSYAAYPNYAAVTYPRQYSPTAWPYIGPFYPYPQVPLGWRKVTLEWKDGWWFLDFKDEPASCWR